MKMKVGNEKKELDEEEETRTRANTGQWGRA